MIPKKLFTISSLLGLLLFQCISLSAQRIYWGEPEFLAGSNIRFPQIATGGELAAIVWQEFSGEKIFLSLRTSKDLRTWQEKIRFAGPFTHESTEVPLFSLVVDDEERIYLAIASADDRITLMSSADEGTTFTVSVLESPITVISPRLFIRNMGRGLYLFLVHSSTNSLTIHYTDLRQDDFKRRKISATIRPFIEETALSISFLPDYTSFRDREYIVYQSTRRGDRYQLYLKISDNQGNFDPDSEPINLTSFQESRIDALLDSYQFDNQRPYIYSLRDRLAVCWERSFRNEPYQIYYMELDENGQPHGMIDEFSPYQRITENEHDCLSPKIYLFNAKIHLIWFDNRRGDDHIITAESNNGIWEEKDLSRNIGGASIFPHPVQIGDYLNIFWENNQGDRHYLVSLSPDQRIEPVRVFAENFIPGRPSQNDRVQIRWNVPKDTSGIAGFSYIWTTDPDPIFNRRLQLGSDTTNTVLEAPTDGPWYFHISAMDNAENWSEPSSIYFLKDTTPPESLDLAAMPVDERGFLISNDPEFSWQAPHDDEISGYTYLLRYLSTDPEAVYLTPPEISPQGRILSQNTSKNYYNIDNGLWLFSVAALDIAGNLGRPATVTFKLDKYVPVTRVSYIRGEMDEIGSVTLHITGRGFTEEGTIREIFLDRDGVRPYDYNFLLEENDYEVLSDRKIRGPSMSLFNAGVYRIGMIHPKRGVYVSTTTVALNPRGTIKLGEYSAVYRPPWQQREKPRLILSFNLLLIVLLMLFLAIVAALSFNRLLLLVREGQLIRNEILALLAGPRAIDRGEEKMKELKRQGMGLRTKFTFLIAFLVVLIVLMVSIPLSFTTIRNQTKTLADGLQARAKVLLGSISAAAEEPLIDEDTLILRSLPNQITAMPEAEFATITSIKARGVSTPDLGAEYVWATNNTNLESEMEEANLGIGEYKIHDEVSEILTQISGRINGMATEEVSGLVHELENLNRQLQPLYGRNDEQAQSRIEELGAATGNLRIRINQKLRNIASAISSIPEFNFQDLKNNYVFYIPIVYQRTGQDIYFRGIVRLGVSTESIMNEIAGSRRLLIRSIGIIAMGAMALGVLGALILASITISPIKKLVAGVALIRDTDDKERLKDHYINIKQKDEIRILADTVNDMTQGLVKAAIANKDLTVGKSIQKMFIPLSLDEHGNKGTTGGEKNNSIEIFGFYEGAKGVSGDYFDFIKLPDGKHYAIIKCDVAGKGVPAALIMIEVATLFLAHFRDWTIQNPGLKIDKLAYMINSMLEERGFKGRFAALILCILNVESGAIYYCNAGDNLIHIYNSTQGKMIQKVLPESPAAGVFPSMLVEMQSGFKLVKDKLNKNDMLLLFTDGIEEAQRLFRDSDYISIKCEEEGLAEGESHGGTHSRGSEFEELGIQRLYQIINSVFNRGSYSLVKYHNPEGDENLDFDFSSCSGSVEDAVLAMVAVEKIFRMYKPATVGVEDTIAIHKNIDAFLKEHFIQYSLYFNSPVGQEDENNVLTYAYLKEDSQYDDLTILGIKKG